MEPGGDISGFTTKDNAPAPAPYLSAGKNPEVRVRVPDPLLHPYQAVDRSILFFLKSKKFFETFIVVYDVFDPIHSSKVQVLFLFFGGGGGLFCASTVFSFLKILLLNLFF